MEPKTTVEERLEKLEAAVRELQERLNGHAPSENWIERITGTFEDDPVFEEILEYGRAARQADRPPEDAGP